MQKMVTRESMIILAFCGHGLARPLMPAKDEAQIFSQRGTHGGDAWYGST